MRLGSDGETYVRKEVCPYGNGRTRMREWDEGVGRMVREC